MSSLDVSVMGSARLDSFGEVVLLYKQTFGIPDNSHSPFSYDTPRLSLTSLICTLCC